MTKREEIPKHMNGNGMQTNKPFRLFMSNACTSMESDSIEDLYINFKIFVIDFVTNERIVLL